MILLSLSHLTHLGTARNSLETWVANRCGPKNRALWVYKGSLSDPITGQTLAKVQGVEVIRVLGKTASASASCECDGCDWCQNSDPKESLAIYRERCGDLILPTAIATSEKTYSAATLLSRKMFLYEAVVHEEDEKPRKAQLLSRIKLRATSPARKVPRSQAVNMYDTAVTVAHDEVNPSKWILHTEFPDGKVLWDNVLVEAENTGDSRHWSFGTYTKMRDKNQKVPRLDDICSHPVSKTLQPARAALVSFGQTQQENQAKFGAKESYFYSLQRSLKHKGWKNWFQRRPEKTERSLVKYSRHGEGPVWYGPNRMCQLELTGKRIDDEGRNLPLVLQRTLQECAPTFFSSLMEIPDSNHAQRVVRAFRTRPLTLAEDEPESRSEKMKHWGARAWDRFRLATSLSSLVDPK